MPQTRLTESEKRQWVALFNDYDLSAAAFCREFSLPYGSFMAWKRLFKDKPAKSTAISQRPAEFVELIVEQPQPSTTPTNAPVAELSLGNGIVLRVFTTGPAQA